MPQSVWAHIHGDTHIHTSSQFWQHLSYSLSSSNYRSAVVLTGAQLWTRRLNRQVCFRRLVVSPVVSCRLLRAQSEQWAVHLTEHRHLLLKSTKLLRVSHIHPECFAVSVAESLFQWTLIRGPGFITITCFNIPFLCCLHEEFVKWEEETRLLHSVLLSQESL